MLAEFELINEESVKAIDKALKRNRLTRLWLVHRLDRDFGIKVNPAHIAAVFSGKRKIGRKTQRMLWCAEKIIAEYENFYGEGRE